MFLSVAVWADEPSVRSLTKQAQKAEKAGNMGEAVRLYNQAASQGSVEAGAKARSLMGRIVQAAPQVTVATPAAPAETAELDPMFTPITDRDIREARELLPPPQLVLASNPYVIDLQDTPDRLWSSVGKLLGLEVMLDGEYPPGGRPVRFQCAEQSAQQVLQGMSAATGSFVVTLGPRKIMVVKDTTQKRQEREPTVAVMLTLPDPVTTQELQEAARAVQQVMEIQKFAIDNTRRMVMMRDRVSKVRPAQKLFEQLLGARPAVVVELEMYEMRATKSSEMGIAWPTSTKLVWLSRFMNNEPPVVTPLRTFGSGDGAVALTVTDVTVTAMATKNFGKSVMRTFVQSTSGMPAQLLLGEKYPILTSSYEFGVTPGIGTSYIPFPSFQFENLGLTMKVTPYVHDTEEMTLEVEAEFKLLSGTALNGIPVLAQRKFTSRVRMRNGQWALMSGMSFDSSTINSTGIPGLMGIPGIGNLFRMTTRDGNLAEMLVVMKPRLLSAGTDMMPDAIFLGPEGRPAMIY